MELIIDWHAEYREYLDEAGLPPEDDPAERAALQLRLAGLMSEYNRLTQAGRHDEAAHLVRWLAVPTHFVVVDPDSGRLFECVQSEDGATIRVVSGYRPVEVPSEPPQLPTAEDSPPPG